MNQTSGQQNLYRHAGELGLPLGGYLFAIALCFIFSPKVEFLNMLSLVLMALFPYLVYRCQRRYCVLADGKTEFAELWMLGIVTIMCGALLSALATWCVVTWIEPNFMHEMIDKAVESYSTAGIPEDNEMLKMLKQMQERNFSPSAIDFTMSMFWATTFTGSLLSAFTAFLAKKRTKSYRG